MSESNLPSALPSAVKPSADVDVARSQFRGQPPARQRVADHVFESLARAILGGELKPGDPVPTQRDLASQFNVSALVVRQAIHRLEDLKLVRVRQGSATIVLDPNESSDIRLIQLQMELAEPGAALSLSAWENQMLFMVPLLALAERRIEEQELAVLRYLVQSVSTASTSEAGQRFRLEFWGQIARATRNPLFLQQMRWWTSLAGELQTRGGGAGARRPNVQLEVSLYERLIAALEARKGAVQIYLDGLRPVLDWMDAARVKAASRAPR
jgi:DNA-binding FadR family transcriptional regulator